MSGYDYGNARLRAMISRLLSRRELDKLAESGSLSGLIVALNRTVYQKSIESASVRYSGVDCVTEALRCDLIYALSRLRQFYTGREGELIAIVLRVYDTYNLKTILRGLSKQASSTKISMALLPVGDLTSGTLDELARAAEPRVAADLLASMALPVAEPLMRLRAEHPGADTPEMELVLDRWYFEEARQQLHNLANGASLMAAALDLEADFANLLIVLRLARAPFERRLLREQRGVENIVRFFLDPGRLSFDLLAHAASEDTLESAVEALADTLYEAPLRAGLGAYKQSGRLSDFERHLRRFRLHWMVGLIAKDPLGIGVPLGYLALKTNEGSNIRWMTQGISLGLKADEIKAEMEYPP
jgi:V/A-type H+-transporting ATPase subunit C